MKKTQFVDRLQEGDVVNDYFVAAHKDLRTQPNGAKFLGTVLKDRTGDIGGILWNNAAAMARLFEVGDVVSVRGSVSTYQGRLQVRVEQMLPMKEGEFDTDDLVWTPDDIKENAEKLRALLDSVQNEWLRKLLDSFLEDAAFIGEFCRAAAGKKWHHACPGGLVRHCHEVARIAATMADLFPNIDRDLLLTVAFLHDIGKIQEMSHDLIVTYTTPGKLIGHLQLGADMVLRRIDAIAGFPEELKWQVIHCILAHHGELTNGSPVTPKTLEAVVLYHCDNLDAQADAVTQIVRETKEKRQEWSEYIPLIERQIWTKESFGE
ncbi:MAG: hypothetical protein QG656_1053 [Candidatus Hydrogenedentes bacterium]|nr:hypothetical protein [Candidatus Hydrogenedentota bacterium]